MCDARSLKQRWINFPLFNHNGDPTDTCLLQYVGQAHATPYCGCMPFAHSIVKLLDDSGLRIRYARLAILYGRDVLRPHIDMYRAVRLLIPLTDQGTDFRHVVGSMCFSMRVGETWGIDGDTCHGAANVAVTGTRVALLIDAERRSCCAPWLDEQWKIPRESCVPRDRWTDASRREVTARAALAAASSPSEAEHEWLFAPFEYRMQAAHVYRELSRFFSLLSKSSATESERSRWEAMAEDVRSPKLPYLPAVTRRRSIRTGTVGARSASTQLGTARSADGGK